MLGIEAGNDIGDCAVAVGSLAKGVIRFISDGQENGMDVQLVGLGLASKIDGRSRAEVPALAAILPPQGQTARAVKGVISEAEGRGGWADRFDGTGGGT